MTVFIKGSRVNRLERVAAALSAAGHDEPRRGALMLRYLAEWATQFHSGFNVFGYLTLRAILAALTALAISFIVGPYVIRRLAQHQVGQRVRSDGPQSHLSKAGTPTMGGALILVAIIAATLLWADLGNRFVWIVLAVTAAFGLIGFWDDYLKLVVGDSRGLIARYKYLWQSVAGLGAALALYVTAQSDAETTLYVPFFKDVLVPLGVAFVVLAYFVIVGTSNAVNLTDGLDGLAIMPAVLVAGGARRLRLRVGQRRVRELPRDPVHRGHRRSAGDLRGDLRRGSRLPVVQHLSRHRCSWATSARSRSARRSA